MRWVLAWHLRCVGGVVAAVMVLEGDFTGDSKHIPGWVVSGKLCDNLLDRILHARLQKIIGSAMIGNHMPPKRFPRTQGEPRGGKGLFVGREDGEEGV